MHTLIYHRQKMVLCSYSCIYFFASQAQVVRDADAERVNLIPRSKTGLVLM